MWNAVQSLLHCDVIKEKESMHFNKTRVILVIRLIIPVLSPSAKRHYTEHSSNKSSMKSFIYKKDGHIVTESLFQF